MDIQIRFHKATPWLRSQRIRRRIKRILEDLGLHDSELSLLFTDDDEMARLNERYLRRKGPTNVMAFPMHGGPDRTAETGMLGDVVISVDTVLRESAQVQEEPEHTVNRLLIHGLLHLLGYDHDSSSIESRRMQREEQRLLELIQEDP